MEPMRNNNTPAVKRIAKRSLRSGRTRNIFAVCAIILTTFMLASVFSIGVSLLKNIEIWNIRTAGTTSSIFLKSPTKSQIETIKAQDQVQAAGCQIQLGSLSGKTAAGKDLQIAALCYDKTEWEQHTAPAISQIHGVYPQKEDEIMLSKNALKQLGIRNPQQGQKLRLTLQKETRRADKARSIASLETRTKTFRLSGWYTDYITEGLGIALFSQDFRKAEGYTMEKDGRLSISCKAGRSSQCLAQLEEAVPLAKGQTFDFTFDPQQQNPEDLISIGGTLLTMALFIILSGYLLIYNVIYISVTRDIRFYGMLKTIGASPRQLKKLVRSQIFRLSLLGIPIGLALAAAASFALVPYALTFFDSYQDNSAMPGTVSFHPWIFLASAFFAFLTVIISCRKPAKIAARVSPVEAVKYTGVSAKKHRDRRGRKAGKLWRMAFYNIFREKKRSILVFASLFMGTITFLGVAGFVGSMQADNYLAAYVPNDFRIASTPPIIQKFDKDYLQELSRIDGVTSIETASALSCGLVFDENTLEPVLRANYQRYGQAADGSYEDMTRVLKSLADQGKLTVWVSGIDERYVKEYNKKHKKTIDADAFQRGETAILGYDDGTAYKEMLGRTITLTAGEKKASVKIGGIFDTQDCGIDGDGSTIMGLMNVIFVSDAFMEKLSDDPIVTEISLNCQEDKEPYVKQQITRLNNTLTSTSFTFYARSDAKEEFISNMRALYVLGDGLSLLLLVIGILNFINVMLTSVYARRQELAVMESIGMTKKQIKTMLSWEGGFYAIITSLLILTFGNGLLSLMARSVDQIADYAVFHYPVLLTGILLLCLFVICLTVPRIVFRCTAKESVTQRLRQTDS